MEQQDIKQTVNQLMAEFKDANSDVRVSLLIKIGVLTPQMLIESRQFPRELVHQWKQSLGDAKDEIRNAAVYALYLCTPPEAKEVISLLRAVGNKTESSRECREQILVILARLDIPEGIEFILGQLKHPEPNTRELAAKELGGIDYQHLFGRVEIREALNDRSEVVRLKAAETIWSGEQDAESILPPLLSMLNDDSSKQRLAAARLLCKMKNSAREAFPFLLALRNERHWTMRLQAVRAIQLIAPMDKAALDILNEMTDDKHVIVSESASKLLDELSD